MSIPVAPKSPVLSWSVEDMRATNEHGLSNLLSLAHTQSEVFVGALLNGNPNVKDLSLKDFLKMERATTVLGVLGVAAAGFFTEPTEYKKHLFEKASPDERFTFVDALHLSVFQDQKKHDKMKNFFVNNFPEDTAVIDLIERRNPGNTRGKAARQSGLRTTIGHAIPSEVMAGLVFTGAGKKI